MEDSMTHAAIGVYPNNTLVKTACAFCGVVEREGQIDFYTVEGRRFVCSRCAADQEPQLAEALTAYRREVGLLVDTGKESGVSIWAASEQKLDPQGGPITAAALTKAAAFIAAERGTAARDPRRREAQWREDFRGREAGWRRDLREHAERYVQRRGAAGQEAMASTLVEALRLIDPALIDCIVLDAVDAAVFAATPPGGVSPS